ncbi:DUF1217 domain-containing protein [Thalassovita taeanensis]|uniref:Flagellar protein n=1 Tax=Thalassovita taeanensis TaxID=657014 RepID=A0A1H9I8Z6_9RHOB|nr:DUF1217 domain-containing protein [Thalassovita taeanensis]SEQ71020.1 Protein of unknown function [Thalassovita taeanensis]
MTYRPIIPATGIVGWNFLERTLSAQTRVFQASPALSRDTAYFEAKIGEVNTAEDLVSDRRLLRVALGAFGLQDDIDSKAFIRKVLEDGTLKTGALASRLTDSRYTDLARTFGFDLATPSTKLSDFGTKITELYRSQQFEIAVGEQDDDLRLALFAQRELEGFATGTQNEDTKWFKIMGSPPLRKIFETALGLPTSFSQLDLDQQLGVFKEKSERQLGLSSLSDLSDEGLRDKLTQRFLIRSQANNIQATSSGNIALTLLQAG